MIGMKSRATGLALALTLTVLALRPALLAQLAQLLHRSKQRFVSPGTITLPDGQLDFTKALQARDPDGHATLFVER